MSISDFKELKQGIKGYEKIYHLKINMEGAGLGAIILHVISLLRFSDRENLYPVVDLDQKFDNAYFDADYGNNLWHQYFEPVLSISSQHLKEHSHHPQMQSLIYTLDTKEAHKICEEHDDSVYSFTFGRWRHLEDLDLDEWYQHQRVKARETVKKYIRPNKALRTKVDQFVRIHFTTGFTLGLHVRGTDMAYAPVVDPAEYFPHIDKCIEENPDLKIFLATDQAQYVTVFEEKYANRVLSINALRSEDEIPPFLMEESTPFKKGEDVMMDILLLSKCDFLIKSSSNVSEMALYFGENLKCLDLAYKKTKAYGEDFGVFWDLLTTKPAWSLVGNTDLNEIAEDASSQSFRQQIAFLKRKLTINLRLLPMRMLKTVRGILSDN